MVKKVIIAVLFAGLVGVLIWGGVNRTLAKSGEPDHGRGGASAHEEISMDNENGFIRQGQLDRAEDVDVREFRGRGSSMEHDHDENSPAAGGNQGWKDRDEEKECDADSHDIEHIQDSNYPDNETESVLGYRGGSMDQPQGMDGQSRGGNGRWGQPGAGGGQEPLDETEIQALHLALDDEYHALATYLSVIDTFGQVEPFTSIAESESRHIEALVNQFLKYGITVPENEWLGSIPVFESVTQACEAGAAAEVANAALYERLFSMTDNQVLLRVFTNLSQASLESHLPEFEACK
jgi:hypothetical protein